MAVGSVAMLYVIYSNHWIISWISAILGNNSHLYNAKYVIFMDCNKNIWQYIALLPGAFLFLPLGNWSTFPLFLVIMCFFWWPFDKAVGQLHMVILILCLILNRNHVCGSSWHPTLFWHFCLSSAVFLNICNFPVQLTQFLTLQIFLISNVC